MWHWLAMFAVGIGAAWHAAPRLRGEGAANGAAPDAALCARPAPCMLDAPDVAGVVALVRALDRGAGGDALMARLARLYATFPPTERTMRRLALMHAAHGAEGGPRAYAVTTVYAAATHAVMQAVAPCTVRRTLGAHASCTDLPRWDVVN